MSLLPFSNNFLTFVFAFSVILSNHFFLVFKTLGVRDFYHSTEHQGTLKEYKCKEKRILSEKIKMDTSL